MTALQAGTSVGRRRGRPLRLPEDSAPIQQVHGGAEQRAAWLLITSRIYSPNPAFARREEFISALKDAGFGADQARVSRWESGNHRVPDRVVDAYEQVLEIAPGTLMAAVHGARRTLDPRSTSFEVPTTPTVQHHELDRLFEAALDQGDGGQWLALARYLGGHPNNYLRPTTWSELAVRLANETTRATGTSFCKRLEALRILVRHPGAQTHVVRAIGEFVTDPDAQSGTHSFTLLQEVEHPKSQRLVTRLLATGDHRLQHGAAWVAACKLARGHFSDEETRMLEGICVLRIADRPEGTADAEILDVVARLPRVARERVMRIVRESPTYPALETMLRTGEQIPSRVARDAAQSIATTAQQHTPSPFPIDPDDMLTRLVREALFHGHQERRHQASVLLTVSPYRHAIAQAAMDTSRHADVSIARPAVDLLRYLATEAQHGDLVSLVGDRARPELVGPALIALGRLGGCWGVSGELVTRELVAETSDPAVRRACLYALGMQGSGYLYALARTADPQIRSAARWWIRTGPAIREDVNEAA